ncbi:MAG: biotin--[acetyl-CoA-carboxylase] ligase [Treponema sp.]|jgi:BirA family biotin operon repressor/biotin-[acetyl-CoA-carboxylase] ligase|nr:biotin--[acetyl-CoA-carboxylase] ligase [Treponema sp.]
MVNHNIGPGISTRAFILRELRKDPGAPFSGERFARALGVSRVAVWKGIRSLISAGYPITSGEAGYALAENTDTDFLYPWEFGEKESRFRYFESTGSTMDRAREYAPAPGTGAMVFTAGAQSSGRGRSGRNWASKPGGLFFTILEKPDLAVADYLRFSMEIQIAVARAVFSLCGKKTFLRWPNDVYVDGKKIAGVLTELFGEGDRLRWISCGVGINVNNKLPMGALSGEKAVSCAKIAGHPLRRREGLNIFLAELEKLRKNKGTGEEISRVWNSLAEGIKAPVALIPAGHGEDKESKARSNTTAILRQGVFLGIDAQGRCVIQDESGESRYVPGAISLIYKGRQHE